MKTSGLVQKKCDPRGHTFLYVLLTAFSKLSDPRICSGTNLENNVLLDIQRKFNLAIAAFTNAEETFNFIYIS